MPPSQVQTGAPADIGGCGQGASACVFANASTKTALFLSSCFCCCCLASSVPATSHAARSQCSAVSRTLLNAGRHALSDLARSVLMGHAAHMHLGQVHSSCLYMHVRSAALQLLHGRCMCFPQAFSAASAPPLHIVVVPTSTLELTLRSGIQASAAQLPQTSGAAASSELHLCAKSARTSELLAAPAACASQPRSL